MKEMLLKQFVLLKLSLLVSTSNVQIKVMVYTICGIGGGNTFRLLKCLDEENLLHEIRKRVLQVSDSYLSTILISVVCPEILINGGS